MTERIVKTGKYEIVIKPKQPQGKPAPVGRDIGLTAPTPSSPPKP